MPKEKHIWPLDELPIPEFFKDALRRLNWLYGKGSVLGFHDFRFDGDNQFAKSGHGTVVCQLQYGLNTAKFRVENGTLHFRGHQMTLKDEAPPNA